MQASITIHSARSRPDLAVRAEEIARRVWPEYNTHGDVMGRHWRGLYGRFGAFQLVAYDEPSDSVIAEGHTLPCVWDATVEGLPAGIDALFIDTFEHRDADARFNTLSAVAIEILPDFQARGLSALMVEAMRELASRHGYGDLIAPVRPSWKDRYPLTPIDRYAQWTREDGLPFDPWMRVHSRAGADLLRTEPRSLAITGRVCEWEEWTGMRFPESGRYVFPRGLAPLEVDVELDEGRYWEPNVWMRHRTSP